MNTERRQPLYVTAVVAAGIVVGAGVGPAGAVNTWNGSGQNWSDPTYWSDGYVPLDDEEVAVNGDVVLTGSPAALASVTVNVGKTMTFGGWNTILTAQVVTVYGTITHNAQSDTTGTPGVYADWTPDNRIFIVCSNLTVASGGKLDSLGKGYRSSLSPYHGYGPGGGAAQAGGSYGGGGSYPATLIYGSASAPEDPGSGGGGRTKQGVAGGGAIRVDAAGTVTVNGTITADGASNGSDMDAGSGSGGSVCITCHVFAGATGTVSAKGGSSMTTSGWRGGGGGGRIAIIYDTSAQTAVPAVSISAAGGKDGVAYGDIGTLYFPNHLFLTETISYSGQWMAEPPLTSWAPDNLIVNNGWIRFAASGLHLSVTNRIAVIGTDCKWHRLEFTNATVTCGGNLALTNASLTLLPGASAGTTVTCGGNLTLGGSPGARIVAYAASTNVVPVPGYGALVSASGDMTIASGSWVYPYSDSVYGGSACFRMRNLTISGGANGGFNADTKGFRGGYTGDGYGPGAGLGTFGGGSYGGRGGGATGGPLYGSEAAPTEPGSGGDGSGFAGGSGGGAVWIEAADAVTHNGLITAQGGNGTTGGGGGSGGGVYVRCGTFSGETGIIRADGGRAGTSGTGGGGGGGRIAVVYTNAAAQDLLPIPGVQFSAAGGLYGSTSTLFYYGDVGTLYFTDNRFLVSPFKHAGEWRGQPLLTEWTVNDLLVTNGWLKFPTDGFKLTVSNKLTVVGTDAYPYTHRLDLLDGVVACGGDLRLEKGMMVLYAGGVAGPSVTCGGNMTLTNSARCFVSCGPTNAVGPDYGALVDVAGGLTVAPSSWIHPDSDYTNYATALFRARNLTTAAGGGFDASSTVPVGKGLGHGTGYGGGGYGGAGGSSGDSGSVGGLTYGSSNAPALAGSGSGFCNAPGTGGGCIRIRASGTFLHNGSLLADGQDRAVTWGCGGSGGGIYVVCRKFEGTTGVISADGGNGNTHSTAPGGGGGGGRIAVWSTRDTYTGTLSIPAGGTEQRGYVGQPGTLVRGLIPAAGTVMVLR